MNHDAPREKVIDGTWGYTSANDGRVHAIGYCAPFHEFSPETIRCIYGDGEDGLARYEAYIAPYREAEAAGKFHDGGHATKEEACECYKRYLLDFHLRFSEGPEKPDVLYKCDATGCEQFTACTGEITGDFGPHWSLCEAHRTREVVEGLLKVGESWHS